MSADDKSQIFSFNFKLALVSFVLAVFLSVRLAMMASETGNWHGAWMSIAHVVIVAVGTFFSVKR